MISPEFLSTDSNVPTIINCANSPYVKDGVFFFTYCAKQMIMDYWENDEYVNCASASHSSIEVDSSLTASMMADTLYRISTTAFGVTNCYYLKFTNVPIKYDYLVVNYSDSLTNVNFSSVGGTELVRIEATKAWTAISDASWLSVSKTSGSATEGEKIEVTAKANSTGTVRTGTISLQINQGTDGRPEGGVFRRG